MTIMHRIVLLSLALPISNLFAQGLLTPPGAPGATMKTLTQVEPRTPISSLPFTISASGSYYLTGNLTSTNHGVIIEASGVSLDLMGFTLSGDREQMEFGIFLDGATNGLIRNVMVHNGIVRDFGYGLVIWGGNNNRFENLVSSCNAFGGAVLFGADSGQCNANTIQNCTFADNGLNSTNGSAGITLTTLTKGECSGNTIDHCTVGGNGEQGIVFSGNFSGTCNGNRISDCTIGNHATMEIMLSGTEGECSGNTVAGCTIRQGGTGGIYLQDVSGNRIDGNHIVGSSTNSMVGIHCEGSTNNVVVRNSCFGQQYGLVVNTTDMLGPIVSETGILSTTNGAAGLSPWANFVK